VAGEGTARATSIDCGRGRVRGVKGSAKVLARDAKDGKSDDDDLETLAVLGATWVGVDSFSGGVGGVGDGVRGGGGWPSDDSQASLAAFSIELARGSNSLRIVSDTAVEVGGVSGLTDVNKEASTSGDLGRETATIFSSNLSSELF